MKLSPVPFAYAGFVPVEERVHVPDSRNADLMIDLTQEDDCTSVTAETSSSEPESSVEPQPFSLEKRNALRRRLDTRVGVEMKRLESLDKKEAKKRKTPSPQYNEQHYTALALRTVSCQMLIEHQGAIAEAIRSAQFQRVKIVANDRPRLLARIAQINKDADTLIYGFSANPTHIAKESIEASERCILEMASVLDLVNQMTEQ